MSKSIKKEEIRRLKLELKTSPDTESPKFSNQAMLIWDKESIVLNFLYLDRHRLGQLAGKGKKSAEVPVVSKIALSPEVALRMATHIKKGVNRYLDEKEIETIISDTENE